MSKTVIFYDYSAISSKIVADLSKQYLGNELVHVYKDSVEWPGGCIEKGSIAEPIGSERSTVYRNDLMNRLGELFKFVHEKKRYHKLLNLRDIDLLETARFDLFFPISYEIYPVWVLKELIARYSPARLVWVSDMRMPFGISNLEVKDFLQINGIEFVFRQIPRYVGSKSANATRIGYWRTVVSEMKRSVTSALQSYRDKPYDKLSDTFGKSDVLFFEHSPHSSKFSAVAATEIERLKKATYCFAATNRAVLDNAHHLGRKLLIDDALKPGNWIDIALNQFEVYRFAHDLGKRINSGELYIWGGVDVLIRKDIEVIIARSLRRAVKMTIATDVMVKLLQPKVIASTNMSNSFARSIVMCGNNHNIPTYLVQHGFPDFEEFENHTLQRKLLVWGKKDKEEWQKRGIKAENIIITGSLRFDFLSVVNKHDEKDSQRESGKLRVTYFPSLYGGSNNSRESSEKALALVLKVTDRMKNMKLLIKTKSNDNFDIIENYRHYNNFQLNKISDSIDVIKESDIVIVSTSNVGLEACVLGKPTIVLNFPYLKVFSFYKEYGCALLANSETEVERAIDAIVNNQEVRLGLEKGRNLLIENVFNNCRPGASMRIAEALIAGCTSEGGSVVVDTAV